MVEISLQGLVLSLLPLILVIYFYYKWANDKKEILYATFRMVFQLIIIGYILIYIFENDYIWLGLIVLGFMSLASSFITLRNSNDKSIKHLSIIFISIICSAFPLLLLTTQLVLNLDSFYEPRFDIPIAGMLLANSMNALSISIERFNKEIETKEFKIARNIAFKSSLIPQINSFLAVGLVSLPGMMTGQILSGIDPLIAVRYQIVIMSIILSSATFVNIIYYSLQIKNYK